MFVCVCVGVFYCVFFVQVFCVCLPVYRMCAFVCAVWYVFMYPYNMYSIFILQFAQVKLRVQ